MLKKILSTTFKGSLGLLTLLLFGALILCYFIPFVHPSYIWIFPLFGLAYPIILLFCCVIALYWIVRKSWFSILMLIIIGAGYPYITRLYVFGNKEIGEKTEVETNENKFTVFSNNVQIFDLYNEDDSNQKFINRDSILAYANHEKPDVVCLQEFYSKDKPTTFLTNSLFKEELKMPYSHNRFIYKPVGRQHFGVVMYSKYPMISKGDVIFETENERNYNFCIYADIVKAKDTIRVYNVHLQSFRISAIAVEENTTTKGKIQKMLEKFKLAYPKRADQANRILDHIQTSPHPVIVCGDFNDTPVSYVYERFNSLLNDAFLKAGKGLGTTYVGKLPAGRIDYMFHSQGLTPNTFNIQKKPFSDHRAISCTFSKTR